MPGLFGRLTGGGSNKKAEPPAFTLELPDGWAGGHGPLGYLEALVKYARDHPECHDRAFELIQRDKGIEGLYLAAAACGPDANLILSTDDGPPSEWVEDAIDVYATTTLEELASRDNVVGDLTASTVPSPYKGWTLRWTWSFDGAPPASVTAYLFAAAGRIWDLTFSSDAASAEVNEATFETIASTFRVAAPAQDQ
jgi:hypothetical protein